VEVVAVPSPIPSDAELRARLGELDFYHSIDVRGGVTTRGWWDLRHALPLLPFPDVRGLRCLDVGTWDGFYAYELERRGANEVVALDVPDLVQIDYPPEVRADASFDPSQPGTRARNAGFHLLHELLDSSVVFRTGNVYDLDPDELGQFDVVTMGSLLLHLRDPVRALDAVRRVLTPHGAFLSVDFVNPSVQLLTGRSKPTFELRGEGQDFQWWLPSDAGYRHLLKVGGFDIEAASPLFLLRPGAHASGDQREPGLRGKSRWALKTALTRDRTHGGHLHRAYKARRRF
jgi:tRNA (mo5U34)-methyltransferase